MHVENFEKTQEAYIVVALVYSSRADVHKRYRVLHNIMHRCYGCVLVPEDRGRCSNQRLAIRKTHGVIRRNEARFLRFGV
jgi:hypothetical protein